jgi:hypothetical protein
MKPAAANVSSLPSRHPFQNKQQYEKERLPSQTLEPIEKTVEIKPE